MQERRVPKRGVRLSDLEPVKGQAQVAGGAHSVTVRYFTDIDGKRKKIYIKLLDLRLGDTYYPPILAALDVLASIFCRNMLGDKAADDRLLFNDNGEVIGSCSIAQEDGPTFTFYRETPSTDPEIRAQQVPDTKTLLDNNFIEILMANFIFANDDAHPHNLGLRKLFDYDMFFIYFSEIIKGPRLIKDWIIFAKKPDIAYVNREDYANFPIINNAHCTHHPCHLFPGNLNYEKMYPNAEAHRKLAENPETIINGKKVSAQEQIGIATLKFLLTREHRTLKQKLIDYFGDIKLNYQDLPEDRQKDLEALAPKLFNNESNALPFRLFAKQFHDSIYDFTYRTTVFSPGVTKNIAGVPVPSFKDQLSARPGMFLEVLEWMEAQNKRMDELEAEASVKKPVVSASNFFSNNSSMKARRAPVPDPESPKLEFPVNPFEGWKYDLNIARQTYQRIHRDAFAPEMKAIWSKLKDDIDTLILEVGSNNPEFVVVEDIGSLDFRLTKSIDFFGHPQYSKLELVDIGLHCDPRNELREAINKMIMLHQKWYTVLHNYYSKDELTVEDAAAFTAGLDEVANIYSSEILAKKFVNPKVTWTQEWTKSINALRDLRTRMCFLTHISNTLVFSEKTLVAVENYRDPKIVKQCIAALFEWVTEISTQDLDMYLKAAVGNYNKAVWSSYWGGGRSSVVLDFIDTSKSMPADKRVMRILCDPHHTEGTMNEKIILHLLQTMLETKYRATMQFKEVWDALAGNFDIALYTKAAVQYSVEHSTRIPEKPRISYRQINNYLLQKIIAMYDSQKSPTEREEFEDQVKLARAAYSDSKPRLQKAFFSIRKVNDFDFIKTPIEPLICQIFSGGWESTSLNWFIYKQFVTVLKLAGDHFKSTDPEFLELCKLSDSYQDLKPLFDDMSLLIRDKTASQEKAPLQLAMLFP